MASNLHGLAESNEVRWYGCISKTGSQIRGWEGEESKILSSWNHPLTKLVTLAGSPGLITKLLRETGRLCPTPQTLQVVIASLSNL